MKSIIKKLSSLALILLAILIFGVYSYEMDNSSVLTSSEMLSNTKIGWGVKRAKDHTQPELGKTNVELMEKYSGIYMGNSGEKCVYLTFDEGYEAGYTGKILDTLKEEKVQAAFFITAHYVNSASDLVQRMIDERTYNSEIIQ